MKFTNANLMLQMSGPPRKTACIAASEADDRSRTKSTLPGLDLTKCLMCQTEKRKRKDRRKMEKTTRCQLDCAAATLLHASNDRNDKRVLLEIQGADVHANDVVYHNSCYKNYTSPRRLELLMKKQSDAETTDSPHKHAFERLAQDVEKDIQGEISNVTSLSSLCSTYKNYLDEIGVSVDWYRARALQTHLTRHFGNRLSFHRPQKRNQAQYVSSSVAPSGILLECIQQMNASVSMNIIDSDNEDAPPDTADDYRFSDVISDNASTIFAAATIFRQAILEMPKTMPFPPNPSDRHESNRQIHTSLYKMH